MADVMLNRFVRTTCVIAAIITLINVGEDVLLGRFDTTDIGLLSWIFIAMIAIWSWTKTEVSRISFGPLPLTESEHLRMLLAFVRSAGNKIVVHPRILQDIQFYRLIRTDNHSTGGAVFEAERDH